MKSVTSLVFFLLTGTVWANIQPADGLWATSDDPANGSGLMLTTQNGTTVVSLFTYDEAGNNVWYVAAGQVDESGVLEATLRQNTKGSYILNDNPTSAEFVQTTRELRLDFSGTQIGTLSIDGSETKSIRSQHFGYEIKTIIFESNNNQAEQQIVLPDLSGAWLLGDAESGAAYILDLEAVEVIQPPGLPQTQIRYTSVHPSTNDWELTCSYARHEIEGCSVARLNQNNQPPMVIKYDDLGNQNMTVLTDTVPVTENYQAFRLNKDRRLLPNDGLWRPSDDPAVGSGLAMRTQGDYTVVLLYSYDESGQAKWQIASGQFDENGLFSAALLTPEGGTAIESQSPMTAEFTDQVQTLEIQLLGLELATFRIDDSEPKAIQNYNFGEQLFQTANYTVNEQPYVFPDQNGYWVAVDYSSGFANSSVYYLWDVSGLISPRPPGRALAYNSSLISANPLNNFSLDFVCTRDLMQFDSFSYCSGYYSNYNDYDPFNDYFISKVNFQDIGVNTFRVYVGAAGELSRDSAYIDYHRLLEN